VLRIYGVEESRAFRVYWLARELGLEFESVPVPYFGPEIKEEAYLAVNPNGRIPAIEDGAVTLFESLAINLYLAKRHGGTLAPRDLVEDALMTQWSLWAMTELERDLLIAMLNRVVFRAEDRSEPEEQRALASLARPFAVLENVLGRAEWLVDARFTVADLNVASVMSMARLGDVSLAGCPRLNTWLDHCLSRPACGYESQRLPRGLPRPPALGG